MFKSWFKCLPRSVRNWVCIPRVRVKVDTIASVCSPELLWRDEGWKAGEALESTGQLSQHSQRLPARDPGTMTWKVCVHTHIDTPMSTSTPIQENRRLLQQTRNEDENCRHFPWFLVKVQFSFLFREENPVSVSEQYIILLIILFGIPNLITFLIFSISASFPSSNS